MWVNLYLNLFVSLKKNFILKEQFFICKQNLIKCNYVSKTISF